MVGRTEGHLKGTTVRISTSDSAAIVLPSGFLDSVENMILLCAFDAVGVLHNRDIYPPAELRRLKATQEGRAAERSVLVDDTDLPDQAALRVHIGYFNGRA